MLNKYLQLTYIKNKIFEKYLISLKSVLKVLKNVVTYVFKIVFFKYIIKFI